MSAAPKAGALAVMRRTIEKLDGHRLNAYTKGKLASDIERVSADMAELIEADKEYDEANAALRLGNKPGTMLSAKHPLVVRVMHAEARRAAALARVGGAP